MHITRLIIFILMTCSVAFALNITPHDSTIIREFLDVNGVKDLEITFPNLITTNSDGRVTKIRINTGWPDMFPKRISKLPDGISGLAELKHLYIKGFDFEAIPTVISRCMKLEICYLGDGPIKEVHNDIFTLPNLKTLSIINCSKLTTLSPQIGSAPKLEELKIDSCNVRSMPEEFSNLPKLKFLTLNNLPLQLLPRKLYKISSLCVLSIKNCKELKLDDEFPLLNVYELDLNGCDIKELPEGEYNFERTNAIALLDNQLKNLPKGMSSLKNITGLGISKNQFDDLPLFLQNNSQISTIACSDNAFKKLPDFIAQLGKVKSSTVSGIHFKNNQIDSIPEITDTFVVEVLDLSHNKLQTLPKSIMKIVPDPNIYRFIFDYNYLHDLDPEIEDWLDYVTHGFGWRDTQLSVGIESPEVKEVMKPNVVQYDKKSKKLNLILKESSPVSILLIDAKGRVIQNVFEGQKKSGSSSVDLSGLRSVGSNFYILSCTINGKRFNVPVSHIQ